MRKVFTANASAPLLDSQPLGFQSFLTDATGLSQSPSPTRLRHRPCAPRVPEVALGRRLPKWRSLFRRSLPNDWLHLRGVAWRRWCRSNRVDKLSTRQSRPGYWRWSSNMRCARPNPNNLTQLFGSSLGAAGHRWFESVLHVKNFSVRPITVESGLPIFSWTRGQRRRADRAVRWCGWQRRGAKRFPTSRRRPR